MTQQNALIIERIFNAPLELVWRAWSEPEHFTKWWGPKPFTCPFCDMDFREEGKYLWCMHGPDGKDYWTAGKFREIIPLKKIVFEDNFADEHGNIVSPADYGMEGDWNEEIIVTVTFEDLGGKTKMIMTHTGLPEGDMRKMAGMGWNSSFDKLAESLNEN